MAIIIGGNGDDDLEGTRRNDLIVGGGGEDDINAGKGNDLVFGGAGDDTIDAGKGNDVVFGGSGDDEIDGGQGRDIIYGGSGEDVIDGGSGSDIVFGGSGDDTIEGGGGRDILFGGSGDDTIDGGAGRDVISGGSGNDTITGGDSSDIVFGGSGNDEIAGGSDSDFVDLGLGDDVAIYIVGDNIGAQDFYDGSLGNDTLRLVLTQAEANDPGIQADITAFQTFLLANSNPGGLSGPVFQFSAFGLSVSNIEALDIVILGGGNQPPVANADQNTIQEDAAPDTVSGNVLANDTDVDTPPAALSVSDVNGSAANVGLAVAGIYGTLTLNSDGTYTYELDNANAAVNALNAGGQLQDQFTYSVFDGTSSSGTTLTISIDGSNDAAIVSGNTTGTVAEDASPNTVTGTLTHTDVDNTDNVFQANSGSSANNFGTFTVDAAGNWVYTLDNNHPTVNALDPLDTLTDSFIVLAEDGTPQGITVTITGTDDASVVAGTFTGSVSEGDVGDAPETATGTLSISDVDGDDAPVFNDQGITTGNNGYGTFELTSGIWTYTLDQSAVQDLDAGEQVTDSITYTATDGTPQGITVTITGTDDASVVAGTFTGSVTEGDVGDAPETATGTLSISDVDGDDAPVFNDQGTTAGVNGYGTFELTSGVWTYTLDQSAVQDLDAGEQVTDSITYTATDSTPQGITVTITGTDDASVVAGTFTGSVTEGDVGDAPETATGTLSISDVDGDDAPVFNDQGTTAGVNGYGTFELTSGVWTYTLDQSAVQDLDAGETVDDTITYTATDSTTQQITVTITGTDDAAVVAGTFAGNVTEGDVGDAPETATGTLSISDVDGDDNPVFADQAATAGDNGFGSFVLSSGVWTYTLDQSAVQDLDAGETVDDTITYAASDSTTQIITVTITGTDDAAVVAGTFTGNVTEGDVGDAPETATGTLSISDVDGDDAPVFNDQGTTAGVNGYGTFELSSGIWTYTLDQSAVQDLDAGEQVTDTITYTATDGTPQGITVTITGTDDASVVAGTFTGSVTEGDAGDAPETATGTLSISDVDGDDAPVFNDQGTTAGVNGYGTFELTSGVWTYTLDQSAVQDLDAGEQVTDSITYTATDGTPQGITVTITGTDDASVVAGTFTGSVTEGDVGDAPETATGTLSISDVDGDDAPVFNDQGITTGDNGYGTFELTSGAWTYTLDQSAVQDLDAGEQVTDSITYTATDGTPQGITVTITGTDDASVVAGTFTGSVTEGDVGDAPEIATGTLSISDVDGDDAPVFNDQGVTIGDNGYGTFELTSGVWTYTLDQSAVQDLDAGEQVTDSITYTATDGTPQGITVTITGTDDASVVAGTFTGSVTEGDVGDAPETATGTLSISDVDGNDAPVFNDQGTTAGVNGYGTFELTSGVWTYTLDQSAVQDLDAGEQVTDTITYTATDGTPQGITVTITGTDDASVVAGTFTGSVTEGDVGDAPEIATGTLSISDVDGDDAPVFNDQGVTTGDNGYGTFELTSGIWTYTLDQSAVQDLDAGEQVTDSITYTATDGTPQGITVTITGTDDASVVAGTFTGSVTEGDAGDAPETATGALSISDVDGDDAPVFNDQGTTAGVNGYGTFELTSGVWTYTLDQSAVQDLDAGEQVTDSITYTATDGTPQGITVTITGTDDASVVAGTFTGSVTEGDVGDAPETATGTLSISDVDGDDAPVFNDQGITTGDNGYGTFELTSGVWTYTLDQSAVQDLDAGEQVTDTITYTATDGTPQGITVTITGTDDASVVAGTFTGSVTEGDAGDAPETATGTLSISDVDGDDAPVFNDQGVTTGDNGYGTFELTSGVWTYTLDQSAVQDLDAGEQVTDSITYTATDGTPQGITVTITGTDDASVVAGTFTGSVTEGDVGDAPETATGTLSISDVDGDDAPVFNDQGTTAGVNGYGTFELTSGVWTYTLDQSAVQDLDAGEQVTDSITYTATDGTPQGITVTITGTDDASVVAGTFTGSVTEGDVGDAPEIATGTLSISDVDGDDAPVFNDQGITTGDNGYGTFELTSGAWTYTLDQSAVQDLDAGEQVTDSITYTATDGTPQGITVTITGTDDASVVAGTFTGSVTEGDVGDAPEIATGTLSISDVDGDDAPVFNDQGVTTGDNGYGTFELTSGIWTYTLDQSAVQDLDAGEQVTDSITYTATDGTPQGITVTITGTDDASVVAGTFTGSVTEGDAGDAPETATGALSISDVDGDDAPVFNDQGTTAGVNGYGTFELTSGVWTYTLDQSAVQDLDAGEQVTDSITYTATDGTPQGITVTITGTDDASVVAGTFTGSVTEGDVGDAPETATGTLSISDVDGDDAPVFNDQGITTGDNGYGTFELTSGVWTYTLDQSAVQDLDAGEQVTDTITYTATDGTPQGITVTITGTDDASVVAGTFTGSVTEGDAGDAPETATGTLSISDVDGDDAPVFNDQGVTTGDNGYGTFELTSGVWTYTLDQSAVQDLDAGEQVTDSITYTATDGTPQGITVTITGTDDASVVAGTFTGSVTEGDVGDAPETATGTLSISDVDGDDAPVFNDQGITTGDNGYGTFELTSGVWTYTLDQAAVQGLDAGDTVDDTITYTATDGTPQGITVTIAGTDDAPEFTGGTIVNSVTETVDDATGQGFIIQGDLFGDQAGRGVAGAGDVNGDGFFDLLVGAPTGDDGGADAGEVYVIFGGAGNLGTILGTRESIDLTNLTASQGFIIQGDALGDGIGGNKTVASAGDINNDGFDDIIVGAFGGDDGGVDAGEAYVVFGGPGTFGADVGGRQVIDLTTLSAAQGFIIQGDSSGDRAAFVSSAGDVNGDGFDDMIVGAFLEDGGGTNSGEAYVVFRRPGHLRCRYRRPTGYRPYRSECFARLQDYRRYLP